MAIMSKLVTAGLFITATFASPVPASDAAMTNYKANEYRSPDCSGPINYPHASISLTRVRMDDTTHSIYLTSLGYTFYGFSDKDSESCTGENLGPLDDGCQNLDTAKPKRIRCVRLVRG